VEDVGITVILLHVVLTVAVHGKPEVVLVGVRKSNVGDLIVGTMEMKHIVRTTLMA
tara:strand:+ start:632 stop:799 length:168 start_codon:yes stop_codon:yes gene_type:complete